ncbi:MAG: DJ-1/PfpI family protein, partial [Clostridiales bacterium]|nr:DJ-1/PfpI family protein [Clostridiales bacterium]
MKKLGILLYPQFSIREISNIMYLFRWHFGIKTTTVSSSKDLILSEEGILIQPEITTEDFSSEKYCCLVLPGCSDCREPIKDEKLIVFLNSFVHNPDFLLAAIGGGPLFLALAGLLENKKFTNSLFVEMNQLFACIQEENFVPAPVVEDGKIITASGEATRLFAFAVAKNLGFSVSENALQEATTDWKQEDFLH